MHPPARDHLLVGLVVLVEALVVVLVAVVVLVVLVVLLREEGHLIGRRLMDRKVSQTKCSSGRHRYSIILIATE